jgi:HPr kinase/phosphorylase
MECRGIGIINIAEMFGVKSVRRDKNIDLVVSLREWSPDVIEERTGLEENFYNILGVRVPHIEFYVRPGRDIARLVEVAALVQALKKMGHDPAKTFNDRLIAHMAEPKAPRAVTHKVSSTIAPFIVPPPEDESEPDPAEDQS